MKRVLFALAALFALATPALAQLNIETSTKDKLTGLDSAAWETMISRIVNGSALVGIDAVLAVNSTPEELTVTCDDWTLVGDSVYKSVRGNPHALKPYSVTFVKTNDFNGYCKGGLVAHTGLGGNYTAILNASDHSLRNSTVVTFSGRQAAR